MELWIELIEQSKSISDIFKNMNLIIEKKEFKEKNNKFIFIWKKKLKIFKIRWRDIDEDEKIEYEDSEKKIEFL